MSDLYATTDEELAAQARRRSDALAAYRLNPRDQTRRDARAAFGLNPGGIVPPCPPGHTDFAVAGGGVLRIPDELRFDIDTDRLTQELLAAMTQPIDPSVLPTGEAFIIPDPGERRTCTCNVCTFNEGVRRVNAALAEVHDAVAQMDAAMEGITESHTNVECDRAFLIDEIEEWLGTEGAGGPLGWIIRRRGNMAYWQDRLRKAVDTVRRR